jgi:hypothetical protein
MVPSLGQARSGSAHDASDQSGTPRQTVVYVIDLYGHWWSRGGSNPWPYHCERYALPTELLPQRPEPSNGSRRRNCQGGGLESKAERMGSALPFCRTITPVEAGRAGVVRPTALGCSMRSGGIVAARTAMTRVFLRMSIASESVPSSAGIALALVIVLTGKGQSKGRRWQGRAEDHGLYGQVPSVGGFDGAGLPDSPSVGNGPKPCED